MGDTDELSIPANTMEERTNESRVKMWFLITANRWLNTGIILVGTFLLLVFLGRFGPSSVRKLLTTDAVGGMFSSMIIAVVTSVTLVLTVAQLVLSQEIGSLGEQQDRMEAEIDFRTDVEDATDVSVSPPEPSAFLRALVEIAEERARVVDDAVSESDDPELATEMADYTSDFIEHSQRVGRELENSEFGSFEVLLPVLNYNYSWKIFAARRLREKHGDSLSEEADDALENLLEVLRLFGPAREYFKAKYFQWEIINVSRAMLYGAMPALAIAGYMLLLFDPSALSGTLFGVHRSFLLVAVAYTLTLVPFAILLAYLLRVLTVVKRTLAIGPFILRETKRAGEIRWNE